MTPAKNYLPDRFIILLGTVILLAYLFPGLENILPLRSISKYGISLIFFFYGLKLSPRQMRAGLSSWKLHLVVQLATFMIFPLLVLLSWPLAARWLNEDLWLSVFFLACLPSTVSSSVVMVSLARGNVPGAIFNASISGLIGILITPLWMGMFLEAQETAFDFGSIVGQLLVRILLPVILGLLLHRIWGAWARRYKSQLSMFDKFIILLIVYESFSNSFASGIFESILQTHLLILILVVIVLFFMLYGIIYLVSKRLHFSLEDRITALFCGSKKSLVHGTVFSSVLFAGSHTLGVYLLPIMIYHAFQLMIISVFAQKYSARKN